MLMICPECRAQWKMFDEEDNICIKCLTEGMTLEDYEKWCKKYEKTEEHV